MDIIQNRQSVLYDNPEHKFKHLTVVIDEVLALSEGVNKTIKDSFFSLLSQVSLLEGQLKSIYFWLVSDLTTQQFRYQFANKQIY